AVAAISTNGTGVSPSTGGYGAAVGVEARKAVAIQADLVKTEDVRRMVREVEDRLGPVDILVNNAGSLVERLRTMELTEERWDEVMDLNAKSAFLDRKSTRLNSSHSQISYAVFCLKKKK